MKCDPRVVTLTGIQSARGTVEHGNHVRVLVGVEHGFFEDVLTVYRREHNDKLSRLRSFEMPPQRDVWDASPEASRLLVGPTDAMPYSIPTNDPALTLSGRRWLARSPDSVTIEIRFPGLVGYLEITTGFGERLPAENRLIEVQALYDDELAATEQVRAPDHLSLTNTPLNKLRITTPLDLVFRVDFLLMEEDADLGDWVKVEDLAGPRQILDLVEGNGPASTFGTLLTKRFWPDVHNRFLERGQREPTTGWPAIELFYGDGNFRELIDQLREVYGRQLWVRRLIFGPRADGGERAHGTAYAARDYDPEELAKLITLTLDVNIATLLGLHTVDRGQSPSLPERTLDPDILKPHTVIDWHRQFDYKVEGQWRHLEDPYTYVYYDLSAGTTPPIAGKIITASRTLDGVEVGTENEAPARFYRVGLRWGIAQDHRSAVTMAYDVYRDGQLLTVEGPVTPARSRERPMTLELAGRTIPFPRSLPILPPFSTPREIRPANFQYVDAGARFGTIACAVESVDIHGRYSRDGRTRAHQVEASVPIPIPQELRAEIKGTADGSYEVDTRWDWPAGHRALAPDWVRFEVFLHDGAHRPSLDGAILWVEKYPTEAASGRFLVEAFVDAANAPLSLGDLAASSNGLLLRNAGRTYGVSGLSAGAGPQAGVGRADFALDAKLRAGVDTPPAMTDGTRGILLKRSTDGVLRVPIFVQGTAPPEALTGGAANSSVRVWVSTANAAHFWPGDAVRVLFGDFLLGGVIAGVDAAASPTSLDGIAVQSAEIAFEPGWAAYRLPLPTTPCTWLKADESEWIDWDDASNWPVGPIAVNRPAEYPLLSTGGVQNQLPIKIAAAPEPRLNWVTDQSGQTSVALSSVVLPTDDFAAPAKSLLTGCQIAVGSFSQVVRQNLKGERPQLVTTAPAAMSQAQANTLLGQQARLSQDGDSHRGSVVRRTRDVGETTLVVRFDQAPPFQEWRLCALRARAEALPTDLQLPPVPARDFWFQILTWRRAAADGVTYEFVVSNLMLTTEVDVDGARETVKYEVAPGAGAVWIDVPQLHVANFDLDSTGSAPFYRTVDGGEIAYHLTRDPNEPESDLENPNTTVVKVTSTAVAVSRTSQGEGERLHVAFYPVLNAYAGFRPPPEDVPVAFYPCFRLVHAPGFLSEQSMRAGRPVYATVRAIIQERGTEFVGPLAPAVSAPMARGQLALSPVAAPPAQPEPPQQGVYARPGPTGSTFTLTWVWNSSDAYEFKVYRIPAAFVEEVRERRRVESGREVPAREVINDQLLMEPALSLRNRSQLRQTTFTDVFESRGSGRYYYKVIALDRTGTTSNWEDSPIIPDPEHQQNVPKEQRGVIVLDTVPPDAPALKPVSVVNGKAQLEWQSDPSVHEYWIHRSADWPEWANPLKLAVADTGDANVHPSLEPVPIVAGTESEPIRCKRSAPPILDLFWLPDMVQLLGLYPADEYEEWLGGDRESVPNLYPGDAGEVVRLRHRDGSEEELRLAPSLVWADEERTRPGPPLVVEYLTEHEVRLPGYFEVEDQEIVIRRSPDIAELVGIYRREDFDPDNPQNPLSGTLDLPGQYPDLRDPYPVIHDVRDGGAAVEDGYRPIIRYRQVESPNEAVLTIYGAYPVRDGTIELVSGPELPLIEGESAAGPVTLPAEYEQAARAITGVYRQSDYDPDQDPADQDPAKNLYNDSYDGTRITGMNLPDDEPFVVVARQFKVYWANRVTYHSLRIEGYPQVASIDEVRIADPGGFRDPPVPVASMTFDAANPDDLTLPANSIVAPGTEVLVRYTDDAAMQRTLRVVADSDVLAVARTPQLPGGLAPYIKDFLGVWRLADYDATNPDYTLELVVQQGSRMFRRNGSFLQVHASAELPVRENNEPVPLAIRFKDHTNTEQSVTFIPGWVRFNDDAPNLNATTAYRVQAVKIPDYQESGNLTRMEIGSRMSQAVEVLIVDPAPPVPPELKHDGFDDGFPVLSWPVVQGIAEYRVQRRSEGSPAWVTDPEPLTPRENEVSMSYTDENVQGPNTYYYRLMVRGLNGKPNTTYQDPCRVEL